MSVPTGMQPSDFHIGWVCILEKEYYAALDVLDETCSLKDGSADGYELGRIGDHNVVINVPSSVEGGLLHAQDITFQMKKDFSSIKFILLVGIGGGAPALPKDDIRLGDVVFGDYVIHYMKGRRLEGQDAFEIQRSRLEPPKQLATAVTKLRHKLRNEPLNHTLDEIASKSDSNREVYRRPTEDRLLKSDVLHQAHVCECLQPGLTNSRRLVPREPRPITNSIRTHRGVVGSADQVLKNAQDRDRLSSQERIICFEMEAAAVMRTGGCITIRGIADYADGHKNDDWHSYAALAVAVCAKKLLKLLDPKTVLAGKGDISQEAFKRQFNEKTGQIDARLNSNEESVQDAFKKIQEANNLLEDQAKFFKDFTDAQAETNQEMDALLKSFQEKLQQQVKDLEQQVEQQQNRDLSNGYVTREEWDSLKEQVAERRQEVNNATEALGAVGEFTDLLGSSINNKHVKGVSQYTSWAARASGRFQFPGRKSTVGSSTAASCGTSTLSPSSTQQTSMSESSAPSKSQSTLSRLKGKMKRPGKKRDPPNLEPSNPPPRTPSDGLISDNKQYQSKPEIPSPPPNTPPNGWILYKTHEPDRKTPSPLLETPSKQPSGFQLPPIDSPRPISPCPPKPPVSPKPGHLQRLKPGRNTRSPPISEPSTQPTPTGGSSNCNCRTPGHSFKEPQISRVSCEEQGDPPRLSVSDMRKRFETENSKDM